MSDWRVRDLAGEARRNLSPRHLIQGAIAVALLATLGAATAQSATDAIAQESAARANGSLVWVATPSVDDTLPADRCDSLTHLVGVQAAGGPLAYVDRDYAVLDGARPLPSIAVTPRALAVWGQPVVTGVWAGADLVATGRTRSGATLTAGPDAVVSISGVLDQHLPVSFLRSHVVTIAPALGQVTECWLAMDPGNVAHGPDLLRAAFADEGVRTAPFSTLPHGVASGPQRWASFVGRMPWLQTAAGLTLVAGLVAWTRRAETAVYRTFGATPTDLWLLHLVEQICVLILALGSAVTVTLLTSWAWWGPLPGDVVLAILRALAAAVLVGAPAGALCGVAAARGGIAAQLKDR